MTLYTKKSSDAAPVRDPARTKQLLLDAGIELFAARGPDGTSIDDICQLSGVNRRMIYHYFGNKQGLYLAALQSVYGRIRQLAIDAEAASQSIEDLVDNIIEQYFLFLKKNPEFVAMIRWENALGAHSLKQVPLGDFREGYVEPVRNALVRRRGTENPNDEEDALMIILTSASLCGFYFSNRDSLSTIFRKDLYDENAMDEWLEHIKCVAQASMKEIWLGSK